MKSPILRSDWSEAMPQLAVLRCFITTNGVLSVTMDGTLMIPKWYVDNWDIIMQAMPLREPSLERALLMIRRSGYKI